jgi:hypothetical protein
MGQVTLFAKKEDCKKEFEDGEIVIQTWAWIGSFDTMFPFLQVRCSKIFDGEDERRYFCYPVPYGVFADNGNWFSREDIKSIGFKWRVPSYEEIDEWCKKHPYDVTTPNKYLRQLNSSRRDEKGWYCQLYIEFPEEKELVDVLKKTGIDYRSVTRDNYLDVMKPLLEKKDENKLSEMS